MKNATVTNVRMYDYPDLVDAYIDYAEHDDGTPFTDDELDRYNEENPDVVWELAIESTY